MAGRSRAVQPQLYAALVNSIQTGALKAGDKLLEAEIMRTFGVGRSPARSALLQMEQERLLVPHSGRGYLVAGRPRRKGHAVPLQASAISLQSSSEAVYDELEHTLSSTVLFSTVRLVEERLAEHFLVSRTVIRDVLARLHGVGLVQKDTSGRWLAERITRERVAELYELRRLLEPTALEQAIGNLNAGLLDEMEKDILDIRDGRVPRTSETLHRLEQKLHVEALSRCSNRALWRALQHTQLLLVSNRAMFAINIAASERAVSSMMEHYEIIRLAKRGRSRAASAALATHLEASQSIWLERFSEIMAAATSSNPPYLLEA
jgi:DNA-binding GntR family transcriptional regulator